MALSLLHLSLFLLRWLEWETVVGLQWLGARENWRKEIFGHLDFDLNRVIAVFDKFVRGHSLAR